MRKLKQVVFCLVTIFVALSAATAHADVFNMPSGQTNLQFVTVGDPGNVADTTMMSDGTSGYGAVGYTYQIGKYDVTAAQYCQFLNAVAKTDTYGLYMSGYSYSCGITRSGISGSYSYATTGLPGWVENFPVNRVSWGDAARFCNWLSNGQPTSGVEDASTTENGAYNINGATSQTALMAVTRNAGAMYWIPTENEWYKAAYYKGGGTNAGYWTYPSRSNTAPSNVLSPTGTNNANYANGTIFTDPVHGLTPVGVFAGSPGPYGTFDQGGDVFQWNETAVASFQCGLRGGSFNGDWWNLAASYREDGNPADESFAIGFRIASVPEPGSITLVLAGAISLLGYVWLVYWGPSSTKENCYRL